MAIIGRINLVKRVLDEEESRDHVGVVKALNGFKPGEFILICGSDPKWVFPGDRYISCKELLERLRAAGLNVGIPYHEFGCVDLEIGDTNNYFMVYKRR